MDTYHEPLFLFQIKFSLPWGLELSLGPVVPYIHPLQDDAKLQSEPDIQYLITFLLPPQGSRQLKYSLIEHKLHHHHHISEQLFGRKLELVDSP